MVSLVEKSVLAFYRTWEPPVCSTIVAASSGSASLQPFLAFGNPWTDRRYI